MTIPEQSSASATRLHFLDNLRTFLIFLVIVIHASLVYESSGWPASFWIVDDPATNDLAGLLNIILDIFIMPGIFFIAGFFTPASLAGQSSINFVQKKLKRIILPWLIAVATLMPSYKVIMLASRGLPQESWTTYFHFSNGILSLSWLWFLPVLFMFYLVYLGFARSGIKVPRLTFQQGLWLVVLLALIHNVVMYALGWEGWTKSIFMDFQNERLLVYLMIFFLGALAYKRELFSQPLKRKWPLHVINSLIWLPIMFYMALIIYPYIKEGASIFTPSTDSLLIRVMYVVNLLLLLYVTINGFRVWLNRSSTWMDPINRNAYGVYILHMIVMGLIAWALLSIEMGSVTKLGLLVLGTFLASNILVSSYYYSKARLQKGLR